jgi:ankyrin repeat protein
MEVFMCAASPSSSLPERASLEQLRKQAKHLRKTEGHPTLAAAQLALARSYGFASWPKLKSTVEKRTLRLLIQEGDVSGLEALLQSNARLVNVRFEDGSTPLHLAAQINRPDIIELLVIRGATRDAKYGRSAHSPLSWAITVEAYEAAHILIELGMKPDLFCAAGLGLLETVQSFWDGDRLKNNPSRTGSSRTTPAGKPLPRPPGRKEEQLSDALAFACRNGRLDVARWLLDHGADPDWRGYVGGTALAWAEFSGNRELCTLLRERGASDELRDYEFAATPNVFGLMVLAGWGFPRRLMQRLAAQPELVNARGERGTLLHAAAANGQNKCCEVLLAFGADRKATDADGNTPAELARAQKHHELAQLLT